MSWVRDCYGTYCADSSAVSFPCPFSTEFLVPAPGHLRCRAFAGSFQLGRCRLCDSQQIRDLAAIHREPLPTLECLTLLFPDYGEPGGGGLPRLVDSGIGRLPLAGLPLLPFPLLLCVPAGLLTWLQAEPFVPPLPHRTLLRQLNDPLPLGPCRSRRYLALVFVSLPFLLLRYCSSGGSAPVGGVPELLYRLESFAAVSCFDDLANVFQPFTGAVRAMQLVGLDLLLGFREPLDGPLVYGALLCLFFLSLPVFSFLLFPLFFEILCDSQC